MKGDSDTVAVKQTQREWKTPERCYKGNDETHRIPNVLECIKKRFMALVGILGIGT